MEDGSSLLNRGCLKCDYMEYNVGNTQGVVIIDMQLK